MAIQRSILLLQNQGRDQCCAVDIAYELGTNLDGAKVLGICPQEPTCYLTNYDSGICAEHIFQFKQEGAFVLE